MNKKDAMKRITREWYLYHHFKNENALLPVIIFSCLAIFITPGVVWSLVIWIYYILYCVRNNKALDNDPQVLKERETWKKIHEEKGDWEECKRILGI